MGLKFVVKTFIAVALVSGLSVVLPDLVHFGSVNPYVGAILFGCISGTALIALFQHGASLGGIGILALYLQDTIGLRAGIFQLMFDVVVFTLALFVRDWQTVAISALGALVVNLVITMNHRRDRYIAT